MSDLPASALVYDDNFEANNSQYDDAIVSHFIDSCDNNIEWSDLGIKNGINQFYAQLPGDKLYLFKGEGKLPIPFVEVCEILKSSANMKIMDPMTKLTADIRKFTADRQIYYAQFAMPSYMIQDRDFTWYGIQKMVDEKTFVNCGKSIVTPDYPVRKDHTRGEIRATGYRIQRLEDEDSCYITYLLMTDVKGWIPTWVINIVGASQAYNPGIIKERIGDFRASTVSTTHFVFNSFPAKAIVSCREGGVPKLEPFTGITVSQAFKYMDRYNTSFVPFFSAGVCHKFVDISDILTPFLKNLEKDKDGMSVASGVANFMRMGVDGMVYHDSKNPFLSVWIAQTGILQEYLEELTKNGRRIALLDNLAGSTVSVMEPVDIIHWLHKTSTSAPDRIATDSCPIHISMQERIARLGSDRFADLITAAGDKADEKSFYAHEVVTVDASATVFDAVVTQSRNGVPAIAVVYADNGAIVKSFSCMKPKLFDGSNNSVFTEKVSALAEEFAAVPVTMTEDVTLAEVVGLFSSSVTNVVWLVDASKVPQKLVTINDVLRLFATAKDPKE